MKITVSPGIWIDEEELTFSFTRSGGPGGQNVNKLNTRATLRFDVRNSPSLSADQKERIGRALAGRMSVDGVLHVISQRFRTQSANRRAAVERLVELLSVALKPRVPRKPTRPGREAVERRLRAKRHLSRRKEERFGRFPKEL